MGLFDIMSDISMNQITKTDTGDNRIFGVLVGSVIKNYDQNMPGRVCVTIPLRDAEANEIQWARMAMPSSGPGYGHYFLPEIGDQVLLVFENGNIEKPYVIGCVPKAADTFVKKSSNEKNTIKQIMTKHGSTIRFDDADGDGTDEGQKDKITIKTPQDGFQLIFDNEKKTVTLTDKEKENQIIMNSEKGLIDIRCKKELKITVGDDAVTVDLKDNGNATLKCKKFEAQADNDILLQAGANAQFTGKLTTLEGSSKLDVKSSGVVKVEAQMVQL